METTDTRRPFFWRQEYLHLTLLLMTMCWLAAWVFLSLNWFLTISLAAALELCFVHLLGCLLVIRVMRHYRRDSYIPWVALGLMLLSVILTLLVIPSLVTGYRSDHALSLSKLFYFEKRARLPGGPLLIFWVLILWWRGYTIGSQGWISVVRASFGMRLGILSFLWVFIIARRELRADILTLIPFFFLFGLLASSLARANSLEADRAGRKSIFGRGWMLSLFSTALIITAFGYIVALWLAGMNLEKAAHALAIAGEGGFNVLMVILSPILFILQGLSEILDWLLPDHLSSKSAEEEIASPKDGSGLNAPWIHDLLQFLWGAFTVMIVALLIFMVLVLIWFLLMQWIARQQEDDEERETLGTGEIALGIRQMFRDSWRWIADTLGLLRQFGLGHDLFAVMTIRRIYSRMEKLAAQRGYPRSLFQTPYEYRRELHQAFPDQSPAIQCITEAYIAVRYGDVPETQAELQAVRTAWTQLSTSPDNST